MYTQCPHCLTLFRISSEELKLAAGKARCCQCSQVFNALETLQESPLQQETPDQPTQTEDAEIAYTFEEGSMEDSLFADTLNLDTEQLIELTAEEAAQSPSSAEDTDEPFMVQDDGLESEPDYLAAESESQISELLDRDSSSFITRNDESELDATITPSTPGNDTGNQVDPDPPLTEATTHEEDKSATPTTTPDRESEKGLFLFTERQKDHQPPPRETKSDDNFDIDEMFEKQSSSFSGIAWGVASLLLILVLMLQLSWQYRELVIQNEYGQQLLTQMCRIIGCTAPQRRDTSKIFIEHRDLRGHPGNSNALLLQLSMVNRAGFAQPLPKLHLSLFNDQDELIAERIFEPLEYISDPNRSTDLMQHSEPIFISMELVDPGKDVTGFKFDFL